jgi:hypothetical protein
MSIYWARSKGETRSGAYARPASKTATTKTTAVETTTAKTTTTVEASTAKSTSTVTASAAAARIRPRWQTESKQTEANNAKYSFCFHTSSSLQPLVTAIAHSLDFRILPKTY